MKQPPSFSTGDPSYFVVTVTSGSPSPTVVTIANASGGFCCIGLRFIDAEYPPSRDATQAQGRVGHTINP